MEKTFLIVNIGSTSKKYALFRGSEELCSVRIETIDSLFQSTIESKAGMMEELISGEKYHDSSGYISDLLVQKGFITNLQEITAVGVRIVAPGVFFSEHKTIDQMYIENLKEVREAAPLHVDPVLHELEKIMVAFSGITIVGLSDSAFHRSIPQKAYQYALAREDSLRYGLRRYGYHGISVSSIVRKMQERSLRFEKTIVCHLGGGASVTAVLDGKSVDTSMGFTPLDGLTMATRIGSIDSGALLYLMKKSAMSIDDTEVYLNERSGLLGLSGSSNDIRELIERENNNDEIASQALAQYVYVVQKHIGMYSAVLGGVDTLVFTGTVGERSFVMRERICRGLEYLGIKLDLQKNNSITHSDEIISENGSVPVHVLLTEEISEMRLLLSEHVSV